METKNTNNRLSALSAWLPSRGNVIFTLVVVFAMFWAQSVNALPWNAPAREVTSTNTFPYQGRLADGAGNPITAQTPMIFRLYAAQTGGVPLWEEQWTGPNSVSVSDGLFNVMLGSLNPVPQSVITGNGTLWLGVTAGADDEMDPRIQLGSVPFAMQALTVPDGSITAEKLSTGAFPPGVPVGTVISWWRATADTPLPSDEWAIADGSVVSDPDSPFNGQALPNLVDTFVMGVAPGEIGSLGGVNNLDLSHVHAIPSHSHSKGTLYALVSLEDDRAFIKRAGSGFGATVANYTSTTHANTHWTDGGAAIDGTTGAWSGLTDASQPTGNGVALTSVDNRPQYVGLVYIVRIK